MPEITSSGLMLERVKEILETELGQLTKSEYGTIFRAPPGGFAEKVILVGQADASMDAKTRCLALIEHLRKNDVPVKIWHDLLNEHGAVIIDKLNLKQIGIFQEYAPGDST
jgi:hypothetical protein